MSFFADFGRIFFDFFSEFFCSIFFFRFFFRKLFFSIFFRFFFRKEGTENSRISGQRGHFPEGDSGVTKGAWDRLDRRGSASGAIRGFVFRRAVT